MDVLNLAMFIALQCATSSVAWGTTGVAKSAFFAALAQSLGMKFYCFIPSQHMPEDIGGMPHLDLKRLVADMIPMAWIKALSEAGWFLLIDELTTAPQAMRPALLSALNERVVGEQRFHPSTIVCAAANPPELAPNSSPLEPSMLNRCYHHQWVAPFDSWFRGMMNGGVFAPPSNIPVVGDYSTYLPKHTRLIGMFCKAHPAMRETKIIPENELAFPSLRTWLHLAHCLSGAEKVGASADVCEELGRGLVGTAATEQYFSYVDRLDLKDADAVVDGRETVDFTNDRIDQLVYLPIAMLEALRANPASKRIDRACEVMISMAEHDMLDLVMGPLGELSDLFPEYEIPSSLDRRYGKLLTQLGGVA